MPNALSKKHWLIIAGTGLLLALVIYNLDSSQVADEADQEQATETIDSTPVEVPEGQAVATFAAGCFWCTEAAFQEQEGVASVISGYAGGTTAGPNYQQVIQQQTDYREAVQIFYDPMAISYETLLDILWRSIDPTDASGQFVDKGYSYTTAIYAHTDQQATKAEASRQSLIASQRFDEPIVTMVEPFTTFFAAEEYHQDYYLKSSENYLNYEQFSGRDEFKAAVWEEIQKNDSP